MNEEKVISILRYFGASRCRPMVSTYKVAKIFGLQWKSAQRWARIMSSLPQENWSEDRVKALHSKYVAIDAGGDPDEANEMQGLDDSSFNDSTSDELGLAWGKDPHKESVELEYAPLGDRATPRTAPSSDSERRASGDQLVDSSIGTADGISYGYDPEGSLV